MGQGTGAVRVVGTPLTPTVAKMGAAGTTVIGRSPIGQQQVLSVVKGTQFVQGSGMVPKTQVVQRTTIGGGGVKQITPAGSTIIHHQQMSGGSGGPTTANITNLVGQKIVLQKSTLQPFQPQKINMLGQSGTSGGGGASPQILKLVKTSQGMHVQGAVGGAGTTTKVMNPATGKIIQMTGANSSLFTINKGATSGGAAGQSIQKRIITGPGGQEQIIVVTSSAQNTVTPTSAAGGNVQIRTVSAGGLVQGSSSNAIKIRMGAAGGGVQLQQQQAGTGAGFSTPGTKQFTIGGKQVTVQLAQGAGKKSYTIMTPQAAAAAAASGSGTTATTATMVGGGQGGGGQQILILPQGQGGGVLQQGRKNFIQIVGGSGGQATGHKILPRIVLNQSQVTAAQQAAAAANAAANQAANSAGQSSSNIEQMDGLLDGM